MWRRFTSFVLRSRPENVLAVLVSLALLAFFSFTRMLYTFSFGLHDFVFILLPVGILGVKCLLGMLASSGEESEEDLDPAKYLVRFFQPLLRIFRDWFPFLLLSTCYYALYSNLILRVNPHTADASLARIDAAIFGNQPAILLQPWINPWLTDFFNLVYFSHVIFLPGVGLYFYLRKEVKAFRWVMMGYLTLILMGVTSYLCVPAVGPGTTFADQFTRDLQGNAVSKGIDYIISVGRVSYDCFPSLHVAIPLLLTMYLYKYRRRFFIPAVIYVACMCFAVMYLRYHYFIDVAAAFVYAPVAYYLNNLILTHWPGEKLAEASDAARDAGADAERARASGSALHPAKDPVDL
jgi:membrane-associated phospholipid phosphatase